uniref:CCHC-type domain-containing protein n=1 Tax=Mycena chlorophos TaxID=658473 RepID=A0ABQ0MAR1_MYCCL|nr:predicted protein [Mycena chlorophos]
MFDSMPASPLYSPAESVLEDTGRPRLRRCRTSSSLFSAAGKVTLALPTKADPTLFVTLRTGNHGSFTPTADAHASLELFVTPSRMTRKKHPLPPVPPLPLRLDVPSISRTASSTGSPVVFGEFDRAFPRPPPPPTPVPDSASSSAEPTPSSTPPSLASVERRSRLCSTQVNCATCGVQGHNFPSCARCRQSWCSRACRLPGGIRHVCSSRPATAIPSLPAPIAIDAPAEPIHIQSTPIPSGQF